VADSVRRAAARDQDTAARASHGDAPRLLTPAVPAELVGDGGDVGAIGTWIGVFVGNAVGNACGNALEEATGRDRMAVATARLADMMDLREKEEMFTIYHESHESHESGIADDSDQSDHMSHLNGSDE
jgi:hypothetical protein